MKKDNFKLKAGDTWKVTTNISTTKTRWLNKYEIENLIYETLKKYMLNK